MASESSELTFVRCPSCRSLVPTSASRCRICNNPLDGGAKASESDPTKQGGRVRQKTISASADELMRMDAPPPPPVAPIAAQGQPSFGDDGDHEEVDPLADFLQEFEAEAAQPVMAAPPSPAQNPVTAAQNDDDDDFDAFLDELDSYDSSAEAPAPSARQVPVAAPVEEPPLRAAAPQEDVNDFEDGGDPLANYMSREDDFDLDIAPQPIQKAAPPEPEVPSIPEPPRPPPARQNPPRQQVERRAPAPVQPPPPQKQPAQQPNAKQARPSHEQKGQRDHKNSQAHHGGQDRRDNAPRDRGESQRQEHRGEESRKGEQQGGGRPHERSPERHAERPHARVETQQSGPKTGKMRPGRLFGWLVSFESPDGRAIELREGKFFVTGSSIRGTDLVIEDPSISTPHALMSVSAEQGFLIQDLMSERGVFVRVGERGQYKREDGVVELKHGDWVRFGDVEFLVTVVPTGR